ncbi:Rv3235 family protein [Schaalia sp. Marseille-Q2122]|uniref:Rv3235 family protein n=1 Tax=Schaalia sp. Marseille-Q2122 TaxID=2736604 RepID=UPI001589824C|nr:Rv3235 family protein [Schaalia sp. Marseille-Q2122]
MSTTLAPRQRPHTRPVARRGARGLAALPARHDAPYRVPRHNGPCFQWDMVRDLPSGEVAIIRERLRDSHSSPVWKKCLPAADSWAANLALGLVEILQDTRPLPQVRRWVLPALYDELALARGCIADEGSKPGTCSLVRWRICPISDRIVESCVIVQTRSRQRTVSVRIEEYRGRWIATALDIL